MSDGPIDIESANLDGNELNFEIVADESTGAKATISVTIDEDTMEGTVDIPGIGSTDLEGTRVPE